MDKEDWDYRPDSGFYTGDMTGRSFHNRQSESYPPEYRKSFMDFRKPGACRCVMCSAVYELLCNWEYRS